VLDEAAYFLFSEQPVIQRAAAGETALLRLIVRGFRDHSMPFRLRRGLEAGTRRRPGRWGRHVWVDARVLGWRLTHADC
jgi:hypothetical protein